MKYWKCDDCEAWVGCHKNTARPYGTPANEELRKERMKAHSAFDPLWKGKNNQAEKRTKAYKWLAKQLGITNAECHIGLFGIGLCIETQKAAMRRRGMMKQPET